MTRDEPIQLSPRETMCCRCEYGVGIKREGEAPGIECVWSHYHLPLPNHSDRLTVVSFDDFSHSSECTTPNYNTALSPRLSPDRNCPNWKPRSRFGNWRDDVLAAVRVEAGTWYLDPDCRSRNESVEEAVERCMKYATEELDGFKEADRKSVV